MQTNTQQLADAIADAGLGAAGRDEIGHRIAVALYKLLAGGTAVEPRKIAAIANVDEDTVAQRLDRWPGVYRDDDGRVVGFWGLAIPEMAHRFHAESGQPMHAWCALDPFLIVPVIDRPARVASNDPTTGEPITMTVTPTGIEYLSPASAVVSLLRPAAPFGFDVLESFCHHVLYFTSPETGQQWARDRDDVVLLPVAEAFEVGQHAWQWLHATSSWPTDPDIAIREGLLNE